MFRAELTARSLTTVSGWGVTPVTRVTVCLPTTVPSSPRWTGTMTELPGVVPVLRLTGAAGGSTGYTFIQTFSDLRKLLFSVALKLI